MSKITDLEYCLEILTKEFDKETKKFADINTQIEENFFLSPKKFDNLCKKKDEFERIITAIECGINYFRAEIEQQKYRERMRNGN